MTVILILLCVIVLVGALLYAEHRAYMRHHPEEPPVQEPAEECCGMHVTCERDSLLAAVSTEIVYYDDEELDRYAGKAPEAYSAGEADEFRDILLSMRPDDIAGWVRSLQLRGVALPPDVRDEIIMIVGEERRNRNLKNA